MARLNISIFNTLCFGNNFIVGLQSTDMNRFIKDGDRLFIVSGPAYARVT